MNSVWWWIFLYELSSLSQWQSHLDNHYPTNGPDRGVSSCAYHTRKLPSTGWMLNNTSGLWCQSRSSPSICRSSVSAVLLSGIPNEDDDVDIADRSLSMLSFWADRFRMLSGFFPLADSPPADNIPLPPSISLSFTSTLIFIYILEFGKLYRKSKKHSER